MPDDATTALKLANPDDYFGAMHDAVTIARMPLSLQVFLDDKWFDRCTRCAEMIARSGMVKHLKDRKEACFAVVSQAIVWRLDPFRVAMATFPLPEGRIGYSGALCQAIIENSGRLVGGVQHQHYGDWDQLRGRYHLENSRRTDEEGKPRQYPVADWKLYGDDERGLGVKISARVKGEDEPRFLNFDLVQAYPRFSTLWATDPRTQVVYAATRRFSSLTVPALFMGVPFDREDWEDWATTLKDVTPRPERAAYERAAAPVAGPRTVAPAAAEAAEPPTGKAAPAASASPAGAAAEAAEAAPTFAWIDAVGEVYEFKSALDAVDSYSKALGGVADDKAREALWENGEALRKALYDAGEQAMADALSRQNAEKAKALAPPPPRSEPPKEAAKAPPLPTTFDVVVPIGEMTAQAWFPLARDRLRQMEAAKCKPVDYSRFREANRIALDRLKREMRSWSVALEKLIGAGERGEAGGLV